MTAFDTIPPTSSTTATTGTTSTKKTDTSAAATLGKDDFLKLLVAQLQHQDPMSPMDNAEYMGQLAQFSTLEQITNVGKEVGRLRTSSQVDGAVSMIGKTVGYITPDGTAASGVVASVAIDEGEILLKVGQAQISPSDITSVSSGTTP